jgi:hypothetical protein
MQPPLAQSKAKRLFRESFSPLMAKPSKITKAGYAYSKRATRDAEA